MKFVGSLLALVKWHIGAIVFPCIDLIWTKELVLPQLLQPMRQPAGDAGHGKDRGKEIGVDAHLVVNDSRVEIYVGVDAFPIQPLSRRALDLQGDVIQLRRTASPEKFFTK